MNCALYFGSFNPLHIGHIAIARAVLQSCQIDELRFVLTPQNPFKSESSILSSQELRLKSLTSSVEKFKREFPQKKISVSTVEFYLPKPNYTYNTLEYLKKSEPHTRFIIVMGADNIANIERWHMWEEIVNNYEIVVYPRKGYDTKALCAKYNTKALDAPLYEISSTMIRQKLSEGERVEEYLY